MNMEVQANEDRDLNMEGQADEDIDLNMEQAEEMNDVEIFYIKKEAGDEDLNNEPQENDVDVFYRNTQPPYRFGTIASHKNKADLDDRQFYWLEYYRSIWFPSTASKPSRPVVYKSILREKIDPVPLPTWNPYRSLALDNLPMPGCEVGPSSAERWFRYLESCMVHFDGGAKETQDEPIFLSSDSPDDTTHDPYLRKTRPQIQSFLKTFKKPSIRDLSRISFDCWPDPKSILERIPIDIYEAEPFGPHPSLVMVSRGQDDKCAICLEEMTPHPTSDTNISMVTYCPGCRRLYHVECAMFGLLETPSVRVERGSKFGEVFVIYTPPSVAHMCMEARDRCLDCRTPFYKPFLATPQCKSKGDNPSYPCSHRMWEFDEEHFVVRTATSYFKVKPTQRDDVTFAFQFETIYEHTPAADISRRELSSPCFKKLRCFTQLGPSEAVSRIVGCLTPPQRAQSLQGFYLYWWLIRIVSLEPYFTRSSKI